jgi:hypothetical protein
LILQAICCQFCALTLSIKSHVKVILHNYISNEITNMVNKEKDIIQLSN